MENQLVLTGVLITFDVLLAFIRILRVPNVLELCEGVGLHTGPESLRRLWHGSFRWPKRHVFELGLAHFLI